MRLTDFALALSTLVLAWELGGQAPLDAALKTVKPGDTVRIRVRAGERIDSRIVSVQMNPLGLQLTGTEPALVAATIDSLWVGGRAIRAGAIAGAIVGGVGSFAFWSALCVGLSEGASNCDAWGWVSVLSLAGAGGGALLGAGIGALVPKWQLRYARALPVQGALILLPNGRLGLGAAYTVGW